METYAQKHPLYGKYHDILTRINNKKCKGYKNYGGRGIKCEWKSYEDFVVDMLPSYKKGYSLDRIDNNGNYSKENCRWADKKTQNNNTRRNVYLMYNGKQMTLSELAISLGIKPRTLWQRLKTYKMPIEKATKKYARN